MQNNIVSERPSVDFAGCQENEKDIRGFGDTLCANQESNRNLYDDYANKYDKIQGVTGFNDPHEIAMYLINNNYPFDILIADFGCGTGILGVELSKVGFTNIIGIDASQKMLEVCS